MRTGDAPRRPEAGRAPLRRGTGILPVSAAGTGDAATPAALRAALAPRLAAWKIPARILVLREFPVTARGKPDRRALAQLLAGKSGRPDKNLADTKG